MSFSFNRSLQREGSLGVGAKSTIYLVSHKDGNNNENRQENGEKKFALKRIHSTPKCHCGGRERCSCRNLGFCTSIRETCICHKLSGHPNVLELSFPSIGNPLSELLSPVKDMVDDRIYLVFPYANGGSLLSFFRENSTRIEYQHILKILADILLGMEFVHHRGIIHRDIKPANILVNFKGYEIVAQVADFGLSKDFVIPVGNTPGVVTLWYRAPEVCTGKYGKEIDIWSIGCILYEMLGKMSSPMVGKISVDNDLVLVQQIVSNLPYKIDRVDYDLVLNKRFPTLTPQPDQPRPVPVDSDILSQIPDNQKADLQDILFSMLAFNPTKRPTASQLLEHRIFASQREHIERVRSSHLITRQIPNFLVINHQCRRAGMDMVCKIFLNDRRKTWYRHIILFHTIEVFDRVIHSAYNHYGSDLIHKMPPHLATLNFLTCLYFMVKYFTTFSPTVAFSEISQEYSTSENLKFIAHSETTFIFRVLNVDLFRPTVWECLVNENIGNNEQNFIADRDVASLIVFLINGAHHDQSAEQAYRLWKQDRNNYDKKADLLLTQNQ